MTCCPHRSLSHTYDTATRRNDGPCLVAECGCVGSQLEAENRLQIRGNAVSAWENVASPQGAQTPAGSDHPSLRKNERG
jgi:hypothetical protein